MKQVIRAFFAILLAFSPGLVLLSPTPAIGQASVQQSAARLDASTLYTTSTTSAATITITPPAAQFIYVTGVEITNCAGSAAVTAAAVTTVTTTGLGSGTTPVWTVGSGATAGLCQPSPVNASFSSPMKSNTAGSNVTFVLPTFATNQTLRVSVIYYTAP